MFEGFRLEHVDLGDVTLRVRHGGSGWPVVLLHGHPRTHTTWHRVARRLVGRCTTVVPDLRGYGGSSLPPDEARHRQSSKRAMAQDVVQLMERLGHHRFAVVGHDRGSLVAFRTAMDHPGQVSHLVVMDGLPVVEHLERIDADFAQAWWHWWFLGQTDKPAERVICADPQSWYRTPPPQVMGEGNHDDLWAALRDPDVVHGMCEDYRAGLHADREDEEADRAEGRQVQCPAMLLESARDDLDIHGDPAAIWQPWLARPVKHRVIDSGHHQAEEAPEQVADALLRFIDL
ncbi:MULTISPECIES: alpha/beta hydrolase [unclassified Streptomyces]|uniref:alpha/beta fold hydrolase n=1 Tax=unclassified Streptomyces TaxID=2593676 RepID=UPI000DBA083A|nr:MULTISPECIES: alpha/beta hydrolase [unclassified Streptomyces]MYT68178.1 alpha/beta fold hydrolase [Streptomyces sp. SID8367]RAJ72746.1 haloacetate dehalogenase [Streptomyces sp. PsTaAH-137]